MPIIDLLQRHVALPEGTWKEKGPVIFLNEVEKWEIQCYREQLGRSEWIQVTMIQSFREKNRRYVSQVSKQVIQDLLNIELHHWVKEHSSYRLQFIFDGVNVKTSFRQDIQYCLADYNRSTKELDLSVRSYNVLKRSGYTKIGDLQYVTDTYMEKAFQLGRKASDEIRETQRELGFRR